LSRGGKRSTLYIDRENGDRVTEDPSEYDPDSVFERTIFGRRVLHVSVMFMLPTGGGPTASQNQLANQQASVEATCKFGSDVRTLTYLDRNAYIRGTSELTQELQHSMESEWVREGNEWADFAGVKYTGKQVWNYVIGPASCERCTPGKRDEENQGMLPEHFLDRVNVYLAERCHSASAQLKLTLNETLSIRLYTGPAFQPINTWLRKVSEQPDCGQRQKLAQDVASSFGATVGHIVSAIQKLSTVQQPQMLFRGLRGVLEGRFWMPDAQGLVVATDAAFMSTSLAVDTPIRYMDPGSKEVPRPNVLWEIHTSEKDDSGLHNGADVSMLSQFNHEKEVLFPPLTMLRVKLRQPGSSSQAKQLTTTSVAEQIASSRERFQVTQDEREGKHFERIAVVPHV